MQVFDNHMLKLFYKGKVTGKLALNLNFER